jgi:uncharacterized RDD family membrane protein YckC
MTAPLYAGFWRRFAAYFLDGLILLIPVFIVGGVVFFLGDNSTLNSLATMGVSWLYFALFHSSSMQATPGKSAFGIKVTDTAGERISFLRATGRFFALYLSALILFIGFLLAAFTERKQALHDMIAGTLVVRKDADAAEIQSGSGVMPVTGGVWAVIVILFLIPFLGGIVAAISIPAYQDYVYRAKIHEVLSEGAALKPEVASMIAEKRLPAGNASANLPTRSPNLRSLGIERSGRIVMELKDFRAAPNGRIYLTPEVSSGIVQQWRCSADDMMPRHLPATCRP